MSSLNTLLEAAKFLEQQEQQQQRTTTILAKTTTTAMATNQAPPPTATIIANGSNGLFKATSIPTTVLITSSELTPSLLTLAQQTIKSATEQQKTTAPRRILNNSFDIIDPLANRAPLAFRSGTREVHNKLEKHRRAQLKECFDVLKKQLPSQPDEKKTSNLNILHSALRCIQNLKRKERELEHEMERLARDKIAAQNKLALLKKDISLHYDNVDFGKILPDTTESEVKEGAEQRIQIPLLQQNKVKDPVQTTALSVLPMGYPQGLVLQKVALVPTKGLSELAPLVSTTHFIAQPHGKVLPLVNAQYVVKPVVVVSRPS